MDLFHEVNEMFDNIRSRRVLGVEFTAANRKPVRRQVIEAACK